ncbi:MAG: DUF2249 domain-containing protein [Candidatus Thermoplasmatota archaeon]|nr:DUF2249 domain-containing protein [Candidatus Thermoplasmatota archaeon]
MEKAVANVVDVRSVVASERHEMVFKEFQKIGIGETLEVVVDHKPDHLLLHMQHLGLPVDSSKYEAILYEDGLWHAYFVRAKDAETGSKCISTDYDESREFQSDHFSAVRVFTNEKYGVIITYIRSSQFIPVHSPNTALIFQVFKGEGEATIGEKTVQLKPGSIIIVPAGEKRGVKARTDMEALHIVVPMPTAQDHEEVQRKLSLGEYA